MAESNITQFANIANASDADDDGFPRMVTLVRGSREIAAAGASDAEDAARQVAIMVLRLDGGLRPGDQILISRI